MTIAISSEKHGVIIAPDLVTAVYANEDELFGRKAYEVWGGRFRALVIADNGDEAGRLFNAAVRADVPAHASGYSFRAYA